MKLRVFASHDWGRGASTHARVRDAVAALRARDLDVWFDETHMTGNILDAMCAGIEDADVVVVFVTRNYMEKVEHGPDTDNVRREFMFAAARPEKLVAVRFDADLPPMWSGPVRMVLGSRLYVDLTTPELGTRDIDRLTAAIRNVVPSTPRPTWRRAPSQPGNVRTPLRARVDRIAAAIGDEHRPEIHVRDVVHALMRTLLGSAAVGDAPLCDMVARLEREVGVA